MSDTPLEVLVYGLGAIGSFYTFILIRSGQTRVTVVARSNHDAVITDGIKITSENHGEHRVCPHRVVKSVAEANQQFDFIVCAHKAIDQSSVPPQIEPCVGEKTTIVLIQNGVGNEEPFRKRFPMTTILSCVTWVGARQPQPGVITHTKSENMQIGLFLNEDQDSSDEISRLEKFTSLLKTGKTVFQVVPDIQVRRWEKVVWNAAWNSLTTLTLMDTHAWLSSSEDAAPMTRKLMREIIGVARALDLPIGYELVDRLMDKILSMPPIGSSMRTDYENGKPMEVDVILGYPVKKGRELGLDVGTAETIYIILTAINRRLTRAKS